MGQREIKQYEATIGEDTPMATANTVHVPSIPIPLLVAPHPHHSTSSFQECNRIRYLQCPASSPRGRPPRTTMPALTCRSCGTNVHPKADQDCHRARTHGRAGKTELLLKLKSMLSYFRCLVVQLRFSTQ